MEFIPALMSNFLFCKRQVSRDSTALKRAVFYLC